MRAAKQSGKHTEVHISGAEGLFEEAEATTIIEGYIARALEHPRGRPDKITITLEKIKKRPKTVPWLPVKTLECFSPHEAEVIMFRTLSESGVSKRAIDNALRVLRSKKTMRGAALIAASSGLRLEPDRGRGTRVTKLGTDKYSAKKLARSLSGLKTDPETVKEALILASKVASCPGIVSEICISDDPDYTTGYIASKIIGYMRVPNIKKSGEMHGGRVFFINDCSDVEKIIDYLEKVPVIITDKCKQARRK